MKNQAFFPPWFDFIIEVAGKFGYCIDLATLEYNEANGRVTFQPTHAFSNVGPCFKEVQGFAELLNAEKAAAGFASLSIGVESQKVPSIEFGDDAIENVVYSIVVAA